MNFLRPHIIFIIICTISLLEGTFAQVDGDLQLTGGNATTGWVEIFYDNQWNRVSGRFFTYDVSSVVCRQLRLPFSQAVEVDYPTFPREPPAPMKVLDTTAFCDGDEVRLVDCRSFTWSFPYSLPHDHDVAVQCKGEFLRTGDLRLKDGSDQIRGRLEIFKGNHWDTFCSVGFGTTEAIVACRQLHLPTNVSDPVVHPDAYFGQGSFVISGGPYIAHCDGYESNIESCNVYKSSDSDIYDELFCGHSQDVGICCPQLPGDCTTSSTVGGIVGAIVIVVIILSIIGCCCYCCCKKKYRTKKQYRAVVVNPPAQATGGPGQVSMAPSGNTDPPVYYHGSAPSGQAMPPPAAPYPSHPAPYPAGQVAPPPPQGAYPPPQQPGYNPTAAASMQYPPQQPVTYPPQPAAPYPPPAAAPYPPQPAASYPPQPAATYPPQPSVAQPYGGPSSQPMGYPHPEATQTSAGQSYPTKGDPDHPLPPSHTATESPSAPPMDTTSGHDVMPSAPPPAYEHLIA